MGPKDPYAGPDRSGRPVRIAEDLTYYLLPPLNRFLPSVGLGVLMEKDNTVKQAGGFHCAAYAVCRGGDNTRSWKQSVKIRSVTSPFG